MRITSKHLQYNQHKFQRHISLCLTTNEVPDTDKRGGPFLSNKANHLLLYKKANGSGVAPECSRWITHYGRHELHSTLIQLRELTKYLIIFIFQRKKVELRETNCPQRVPDDADAPNTRVLKSSRLGEAWRAFLQLPIHSEHHPQMLQVPGAGETGVTGK